MSTLNLDQICEDLRPMVLQRVSQRVPQDEAEDITQDTMVGFLEAWSNFRGEAKLGTLALAIADNKIADYWRKRKRDEEALPMAPHPDFPGDQLPIDEMEDVPSKSILPDEAVIVKELRTTLQALLKRLKPHQAIVFSRWLEGESEAEIARSLNVNRSTVCRWVNEASRKFRKALER